jgi:hypothetical protein
VSSLFIGDENARIPIQEDEPSFALHILRGDERHVSRDSVSPMIELTIPPTSATAATCTSEVGLVAAPPIAPCGQVQRRKGNNGQPK